MKNDIDYEKLHRDGLKNGVIIAVVLIALVFLYQAVFGSTHVLTLAHVLTPQAIGPQHLCWLDDGELCRPLRRGDVNGSGSVDNTDLAGLAIFLTSGLPEPHPCMEMFDVNADGTADQTDLYHLATWLHSTEPIEPPEFFTCHVVPHSHP